MERAIETEEQWTGPTRTLVIMAKAPKAGRVKTRLNGSLPSEAVTALYRCLLEDTVTLAWSVIAAEPAVMCPEADQEELTKLLGHVTPIVAQSGEGLAAGLTSVFRHFNANERHHVIAFNSDSPHISPRVIERAFEILSDHDVVVGPTHDGGYYLVGAKASHPSLFENDGMGTKSALERLLAQTKALGLTVAFAEPFYDVDVPEDLVRLGKELKIEPLRAPKTAGWFDDWRRAVSQLPGMRQETGQDG